jgi:large subunit ribosomal protein L19
MRQCQDIQQLEADQLKKDVPEFHVGDTISVHQKIAEGDKERIQLFTGTVIARRGGGLSETITLYRHSYGAGIERIFLLHSPKIAKIEIVKTGKVRKGKLYYLRGTSGKASKIKEHIGVKGETHRNHTEEKPIEEAPAT